MYRKVRLACAEDTSQREAARHFSISRDCVRKMVAFSVPPGYRRTTPVKRSKMDGFPGIIDGWLEGDRDVHRKQRHTAKRVFERLRDENGFTGGYTIIKDYMRKRELRGREMFVPLAHPPGHTQADFGEAIVIIGGVDQKTCFFVLDLPHSDACFVRAYPEATAEASIDGHIHAFAFFARVPASILYDNDRCLVSKIRPDGTRLRATLFSGLLSHYLVHDRHGRPGNDDKGKVERPVGLPSRNFMVPIPRFATWSAFNAHLEEQCRKRHTDVLRGRSETIGRRLARDLSAMSDLPAAPFDACDQATGRVSSQALVRYKTNDCPVPVAYGHRDVWVRGYFDSVVIGCGGEAAAVSAEERQRMLSSPVGGVVEQDDGRADAAMPEIIGYDSPEVAALRGLPARVQNRRAGIVHEDPVGGAQMSHAATTWAIQQRGLKPASRIVLWFLCGRHNPDFGCFPTQARIAEDAKISISALNDRPATLKGLGLIRRIRALDPHSHRRLPTRHDLAFEPGFPQKPAPESGDGVVEIMEENGTPFPELPDGAISGFPGCPSPDFPESHLRFPEYNLVREPLTRSC